MEESAEKKSLTSFLCNLEAELDVHTWIQDIILEFQHHIWTQDPTFKKMVPQQQQKQDEKRGWGSHEFMRKLKNLNERLERWNRKVVGNVKLRKQKIFEKMND